MPNSETNIALIERLTRVEEKLDNALSTLLDNRSRMDSHEGRLRSLENQGARLLGMGTIVAAVAGLFSSRAVELIAGATH